MTNQKAKELMLEHYINELKTNPNFGYCYVKQHTEIESYYIVVGIINLPDYTIESFIPMFSDKILENINAKEVILEKTKRVRPCDDSRPKIRPSISIGNEVYGNAGTLGGLVKKGSKYFLISCNHVLKHDMGSNPDDIPQVIVTPGKKDLPQKKIAEPIEIAESFAGVFSNHVDAGFAVLNESNITFHTNSKCSSMERYEPNVNAREGEVLKFCPRNRNVESSIKVISVHGIVRVEYSENGESFFKDFFDQVVTEKKTVDGDSGSFCTNENQQLIGMVFSHSENYTFHNPINDVFVRLILELNLKYPDLFKSDSIPYKILKRCSNEGYNSIKQQPDLLKTINQTLSKISIINF